MAGPVVGDILYYKCHAYLYDSGRNLIRDLGDFKWYLPYYSRATYPGTGTLINNGSDTTLFAQWYAAFPQLNWLSGYKVGGSVKSYVNTLFPNLRIASPDAASDILVIENLKTGKVVAQSATSSNGKYCSSLTEFENGGGSTYGMYSVMTYAANDGYNATLGRSNHILAYTGLNANGNPNGLFYFQFTGFRSTTNSLQLESTGWENNFPLGFFDGTFVYTTNPYGDWPISEPGGGGGEPDPTDDVVDLPPLPTFSFAGTGFTRIYNPTLSQLNDLASYLWSDQTFIQTLLNHAIQIIDKPIDALISLAILPVPIPTGTTENFTVLFIPTGKYLTTAAQQFVDVDCGTVEINEVYHSALDYNPYTKVDLFLPFIGQVTLNTDEVMNKTLHLIYRVDIVSGMCVANIYVGNSVLYQYTGNCAIFMPLTASNFSDFISGLITVAGAIASGGVSAASGGAGAVAEAAQMAAPASETALVAAGSQALTTPEMAASDWATNELISGAKDASAAAPKKASFSEMEKKIIRNSVNMVVGSKIHIDHSGSMQGNAGILGVRRPYVILNRPRIANPENYDKYNGCPSMMYLNLGNCKGYTEVQEVQLTGFSATNPELGEIASLLKSGVIL